MVFYDLKKRMRVHSHVFVIFSFSSSHVDSRKRMLDHKPVQVLSFYGFSPDRNTRNFCLVALLTVAYRVVAFVALKYHRSRYAQ
jgi:hypothetical protein